MQNFKTNKFKEKNLNKENKLKVKLDRFKNLSLHYYEKPQVLSEEIMGVAALACGKCASAGLQANSFTCRQLPSGS